MRKITVLLGLLIEVMAIFTMASAIALLARPDFSMVTTAGNISASLFFGTDVYASITLVLIGIAIIYIGLKGED
jgi:hypothetical protein